MKTYVIVEWPNSQIIMEQSWFNECYLINDTEGIVKHGFSAYFVPTIRYATL